jgi:hypothetical protein
MKRLVALVIGIVAFGCGFYCLHYARTVGGAAAPDHAASAASTTEALAEPPAEVRAPSPSRDAPAGFKAYLAQAYHFSVVYPSALSVREQAPEKGGPLGVLFTDASGAPVVRIYVLPYSEGAITSQRIALDLPSGVVEEQVGVRVGGVEGIMFRSADQALGDTREVWFIRQGLLYEIDAPLSRDSDLQALMRTWEFIP